MMNLLVNVSGGGDLSEVPCALLRLTPEQIKTMIARIEQVKQLKETDREFYCVERWDGSALWFDRSRFEGDESGSEELDAAFEEVDASTMTEISDELATVVNAGIDAGYTYQGEGASIRTECGILVVTDDSCHWNCYVKHTDVRLETECLSLEELRVLLKKD